MVLFWPPGSLNPILCCGSFSTLGPWEHLCFCYIVAAFIQMLLMALLCRALAHCFGSRAVSLELGEMGGGVSTSMSVLLYVNVDVPVPSSCYLT